MHQTKVFDDPKEITVALAPAKARPRRWRPPGFAISILAGMLVFALFRQTILSQVGALLIVEDPLRQAIAIISLAGQTPFREIEAAQLYRQGWARELSSCPLQPLLSRKHCAA